MTRFFRSKSCGLVGLSEFIPCPPPSPFLNETDDEEEEDDLYDAVSSDPNSTPLVSPVHDAGGSGRGRNLVILDMLVTALRKSLVVTCNVERDDVITPLDISSPMEVRHVSHVTFDQFNGFLGLPTELEPDVPRKVPSASVKVFGVSAKSMQCSYDDRGNSVPTILLMMQRRLYVEGGLKAEGIFRINGENSQEEYVRDQLNKGIVPRGIDVHCLAGLIKAWFRELPSGVLDSLTPEQVMNCNTEDDCVQLARLLPPTEAALLDWAINLMADVVDHEQYNKMNARNIAMVFAPNMTQMADPLTALLHAVQVMNFLKTLILKTLCEREDSSAKARMLSAPVKKHESCQSNLNIGASYRNSADRKLYSIAGKFSRPTLTIKFECPTEDMSSNFQRKIDEQAEQNTSTSGNGEPSLHEREDQVKKPKGGYDNRDRLRSRNGLRRLRKQPKFQIKPPENKSSDL